MQVSLENEVDFPLTVFSFSKHVCLFAIQWLYNYFLCHLHADACLSIVNFDNNRAVERLSSYFLNHFSGPDFKSKSVISSFELVVPIDCIIVNIRKLKVLRRARSQLIMMEKLGELQKKIIGSLSYDPQ